MVDTGHETEFMPNSVELAVAGTCMRQRQKERQASSHRTPATASREGGRADEAKRPHRARVSTPKAPRGHFPWIATAAAARVVCHGASSLPAPRVPADLPTVIYPSCLRLPSPRSSHGRRPIIVWHLLETVRLLMAEIDTTPLESVKAAVDLFDRPGSDQSRLSPDGNVRRHYY